MSKQYNMRWSESDAEKLFREINNFNQRLRYQQKKQPENAEFLPDRVNVNKAVKGIETRQDFNRLISRLKKFNAKTAEVIEPKKGVKVTKWQDQESKLEKKRQVRENRRKLEEIGEKEVKVGGAGQGSKRKEMGKTEDRPRTKDLDWDKLSPKEYQYALKSIDLKLDADATLEKQMRMRENYIKGLTENGFIDAAPELLDFIKGVDFETFYETQQVDDTATFAWYRDPAGFEIRLEYMLKSWETAYNNYIAEQGG